MSGIHPIGDSTLSGAAAASELDDIVYRISHDLRASVRALRELPSWLAEDLETLGVPIGDEPERTLALIHSHARRLDEMLNGLLSYSRVGRLQEVEIIRPALVFEDLLKDLSPPPDVQFFTQFNPVDVQMGAGDLAKIFQVLVSNAIRHNPTAHKHVEITSCKSGRHWEVMVADNGPGIRKEHRDDIFRPMVKLVSRDADEGGGMGLAILRKIAEIYGGTVHVEDRKRRGGTLFRVRLPVVA